MVASKFHVFFEVGFRIDFLKKNRSLALRFGGQMAIKTLPKSHHKITEILIDFLNGFWEVKWGVIEFQNDCKKRDSPRVPEPSLDPGALGPALASSRSPFCYLWIILGAFRTPNSIKNALIVRQISILIQGPNILLSLDHSPPCREANRLQNRIKKSM